MIVRSHVANGGDEIIITGHELPWRFKKGSQAFSRKLEKQARIIHIPDPNDVFVWCEERGYKVISIEIQDPPIFISNFTFPSKCAITVGNEATGLPTSYLSKSHAVITIPHYGKVGSMNVAISASIAMYEYNRDKTTSIDIVKNKYVEKTHNNGINADA